MPTLYIVRHAWAEERDAERWPDDGQRPLTVEGKKRFRRFAKRLAEREVEPKIIATSPLVRCRQTADVLHKCLPESPAIVERAELAPGGDVAALFSWSAEQQADVLWVGHSPDVERHLAQAIGGISALIHFSKGAVAAVRFTGPIAPGQGELAWLATTKILGM